MSQHDEAVVVGGAAAVCPIYERRRTHSPIPLACHTTAIESVELLGHANLAGGGHALRSPDLAAPNRRYVLVEVAPLFLPL